MIGETLKQLRKEKKLTQDLLAKEVGISKFAIRKYESNERNPDFETMIKFAQYFDVSVDFLLGRSALKRVNGIEFLSNSNNINDDLRKLEPEQQRQLTQFLNKCYLIIERQTRIKFDERLLKQYINIAHSISNLDSYLGGYFELALTRKKKFDKFEVEKDIRYDFYEIKESINRCLDELLSIYLSDAMAEIEKRNTKQP